MAGPTSIEWTDTTWNPVRGCTKVSPGCKFCYAEAFAERFRGVPGHPYERGFDARLAPDLLDAPLRWQKPRRVFVNSMSDLFGEFVPNEYIAAVFGVMASARRHTFQVLTKRATQMRGWFALLDAAVPEALAAWVESVAAADVACPEPVGARRAHEAKGQALVVHKAMRTALVVDGRAAQRAAGRFYPEWPPPNVHLGVSVEDKKHGLPRIEELRRTPAALRFLSVEPLLEELGPLDLTGIGWVIVGGESGHHARSCSLAWIRAVVRQCDEQGVPVFVKQLGARPVGAGAPTQLRRSKGNDPALMPTDLAGRRAFPEVLP
jgi:protein gp37